MKMFTFAAGCGNWDTGVPAAGAAPVSDAGVAATVVALCCGGWLARVGAGFVLGVLVFIGDIFSGLSTLDVAAVGHLISGLTALACAAFIRYREYRRLHPAPALIAPAASAQSAD